jgi:translocator protein
MGYASWRIWSFGEEKAFIPLVIYVIKVVINWLWPIVAFGLGSLFGAIINSIFLLIFLTITGVLFFQIDMISGLIFIPYFLYMSYVLVLCTHIYIINKKQD